MKSKPKRPKDANQLAYMIAGIATGDLADQQKSKGQVKGGRIGGKARAAALTPKQRSEIARAAAQARWQKSD